ncbi:hypothetical protein ACFR9U_05880 [Halorientalis brevis]|uniref:KaiC-like domain-containing protein n=1 Tax=Halorientalis brevis TaxID=1126241 RepID=A0ABD6C876_9EURY|nr:hypothetical protein [Halorientalis brevis]
MRRAAFGRSDDAPKPADSSQLLGLPAMVESTPVVNSRGAAWQRPPPISSMDSQSGADRQRALDELSPGTYLLSGAAYTGRRDLALRFVSEPGCASNAGVVISPNDSAETVSTRLKTLLAGGEGDQRRGETPDRDALFANYGIIECQSSHREEEVQHDGVQYASTPGALTTVGVRLTNQLERLAAGDRETVRLGLLSLSTILVYTDLETVVEFVSTVRSLLDEFDGTGVLVFNPRMHDDQTVETLAQTVDGVLDVPDGPR